MIYEPLRIFSQGRSINFFSDRNQLLLTLSQGTRILHVGCTDTPITRSRIAEGTLLHGKLTDAFKDVVGIDINDEDLGLLRDAGYDNVRRIDAEHMSIADFAEPFDVILAGDVVEHLNNPGLFVECAKNLLRPGGVLIIGVPSEAMVSSPRGCA